ncbi:ABC transporter ATP-binding protein [Paenibacillus sp. VCA1]|uniref:ABC transporter ATP-binding protein n=1 Tax=Paenibacillus sp. VCA1 TaxID=3039148 RepID=UPI0028713403|nr:ABC transporter ATP-binding protein [Paenibacillus sp. VCA1]MDR9853132.1 ABC transporter ATP-binding protein [Paenibacillus sp. VCA1]
MVNQARSAIIEVLNKSKKVLFLILFFNISASLVSILQPVIFKDLFDELLPKKEINTAIFYILIIVFIPIVFAALNSFTAYYNNELGNKLSKNLRVRLFSHLLQIRPKQVDQVGRGEIINRLTSQVGMLCEVFVVETVMSVVSNLILLFATLWIMFSMSFELTLVAMISFPVFMYIFKRFRKKTEKLDGSYYSILEKGMSYLNDFFSNLKSVQIFNGQEVEKKRWNQWNDQAWKISKQSYVFHNMVVNLIADTVISLITGIIYGYSLYLILSGKISSGTLLAFIILLPRLYSIFKSLFTVNIDLTRMKVIMGNINEILNLEKLKYGILTPDFNKIPRLEFKNVSYSYAGENSPGISNFNLDVAPGSFIGIVGLSGSGKSTLFELVHRHIEPESGEILLDGTSISEFNIHKFRKYVGYNPQKTILWNHSILENIIYPIKKEEMNEALIQRFHHVVELAHVKDFVEIIPNKYDTKVESNGENLSGGEIQRILLARTFMNDPKILMLDEYTSALDAITESYLNDTLLKLKGHQTILVIAHRLSTIKYADFIIVVDNGKIVEKGSPDELLSRKGIFYSMHEKQKI